MDLVVLVLPGQVRHVGVQLVAAVVVVENGPKLGESGESPLNMPRETSTKGTKADHGPVQLVRGVGSGRRATASETDSSNMKGLLDVRVADGAGVRDVLGVGDDPGDLGGVGGRLREPCGEATVRTGPRAKRLEIRATAMWSEASCLTSSPTGKAEE